MAGQLLLAVDQGTHATRAIVFDRQGRTLATALQPVALHRHNRDEVEQDAAEILASLQQVVAEVLAAPGISVPDIDAAGLATQRSSVVAWNRVNGAALGPVLSWQDRRNAALIDELAPRQGMVQAKTGLRLSAHYGASKLRWLLERNPAVAQAATSGELGMGPLVSWLLFHWLEGNPALVDHANASRTLLWNLHTRDWDAELLALFRVPAGVLPACRPIRAEYGVTRPGGIPLRAVNGDQTAALFAQGRPAPGTIIANLGTGAFVLLPVPGIQQRPDGLLAGIAHSHGGHADYYLEGTVNGAGAALEWAARQLALPAVEPHLPGWLAGIEDPPLFINTVGGLGAPWWQAGPEPHFHTQPATPAHGMVAVVESVLFLMQVIIQSLQTHASTISGIQLSGGLARLDGLCQRLADLSGLSVRRPAEVEATARGIAWQAAGCPQDWPAGGNADVFQPQPNPALRTRYHDFIRLLKQQL
jgi:glycerol kinase